MTRPRYERKQDRLLHGRLPPDQMRCDVAIAPFDRRAWEADRRWGIDRLPEVCTPETAAKYASALAKLNAAIASDDPEEVAIRAAVCIRGMDAMEREAEVAGKSHLPPQVVEAEVEGQHYAIVSDPRDLQFYKEKDGAHVFTLREVVMMLRELIEKDQMLKAVKDHFPKAEIAAIRKELPKTFWEHGDEVDF